MKRTLSELALFGGRAQFSTPLYVGRPNLGNRQRFLGRVNQVLDSRWLTNNGPLVQELETRLASLLQVSCVAALCNGTLALELAVRACGLGGEVIVPSLTFVATVHCLAMQGITPVFCDIDPLTHNLDPQQVEALITPRTTGILAVHLWGRACEVEALESIARKHDLVLIYDAAHAFACSKNNQMVGNFGQLEAFSFHATKFFNTFEGGAVATNNPHLAEKIRQMRNFGFVGADETGSLGTNAKMSEIAAAMGLTLLDELESLVATNRDHYLQYQDELATIPGVKLVSYELQERQNFQFIVLEIDAEQCGLHREVLSAVLQAENVHVRRYFYPGVHRMEPYRTLYPDVGKRLVETERISERLLALPTGTAVTAGDIEALCQLIRFSFEHAGEIAESFGRQ